MVTKDIPVSVIMTAYNRERYIADAIESVLASTFTDFELIIVDDTSTDNTVNIARKYEEQDSRVKVYVNEKNLGDYPNRNRATSLAKGKYLKYVDADDLIYPWGLEILVNCMEKYPDSGWGLCSIYQDEERIFPFCLDKSQIFNYHYTKNGLFQKAGLSSIITREIFEKIGGFSGRRHLGDLELWVRLSLISSVVLMPDGVVWHRIHDEQESKANRIDEFVPLKYDISMLNFLKNNTDCMPPKLMKKIQFQLQKIIVKKALKFLIFFRWNNLKKVIFELKYSNETFN